MRLLKIRVVSPDYLLTLLMGLYPIFKDIYNKRKQIMSYSIRVRTVAEAGTWLLMMYVDYLLSGFRNVYFKYGVQASTDVRGLIHDCQACVQGSMIVWRILPGKIGAKVRAERPLYEQRLREWATLQRNLSRKETSQ